MHIAACASWTVIGEFLSAGGVHHEKNSPADCGAAFGFFTFALVSCDRHDFFRWLALLHGY